MKRNHFEDLRTAVQHIHAADPEAFRQSAAEMSKPGHRGKKALIRLGITLAPVAVAQIPVIGELVVTLGTGFLLAGATEVIGDVSGLGLGIYLAAKYGKRVDSWFGLDKPQNASPSIPVSYQAPSPPPRELDPPPWPRKQR